MYDVVVPATSAGQRVVEYLETIDLEQRAELEVRLEHLANYGEIHRRDAIEDVFGQVQCFATETERLAFLIDNGCIVLLHGFAHGPVQMVPTDEIMTAITSYRKSEGIEEAT